MEKSKEGSLITCKRVYDQTFLQIHQKNLSWSFGVNAEQTNRQKRFRKKYRKSIKGFLHKDKKHFFRDRTQKLS